MRRLAIAGTLALAAACAGDNAPSQESGRPTGGSTTADAASSGKVTPMADGFDKALAAFRAHATKTLGVSDDKLNLGPPVQAVADTLPEKVGAAWPFIAAKKDDPQNPLRGWAIADGTVITTEQNLGVLLDQAGVWDGKADAQKLAERIVWALGAGYGLHTDPLTGGANPKLTSDGGAGKLELVVDYRPPGPGGSGGGPVDARKITVAFTPDKRATLSR